MFLDSCYSCVSLKPQFFNGVTQAADFSESEIVHTRCPRRCD